MAENIGKKTNPSRVLVPEEFFLYTGAAANADFKDHKVTHMASDNIKNIGKSIGVKVLPILFAKVSVLVSAILLTYIIGIVIGNTFSMYR